MQRSYNSNDTLYGNCKKYKTIIIKEAYKESKQKFIKKAYIDICHKITSKKDDYTEIWDALHYINLYILDNIEEYKRIVNYHSYFYKFEKTDKSLMTIYDNTKQELKKELNKRCKHYRYLMKELKKK